MIERVLQITDTHLIADRDGEVYQQNVAANLQAVVDSVSHVGPFDLLILSGDVSNDDSRQSYEHVRDIISIIDAPVAVIPGNHDQPALLGSVLPATPSRIELTHWNVLLVNSQWPGHIEGLISEAGWQTLAADVDGSPGRHTLLAVHHPPQYPCSNEWCRLSDAHRLTGFAREHAVRLVISGHVHHAFQIERDGTLYCTAPSTCIGFDHSGSHGITDERPGAALYSLHDDGRVDVEVIYVRG